MPYIPEVRRKELERKRLPERPGELAYLIWLDVLRYIEHKGASYATYAEVLGILQATSLELYRRRIGAHENDAIARHGDVVVD